MKKLLLKDVNAVVPDGAPRDVSVLIADGRIEAIDAVGVVDGTEEVSLAGATLFPGFIDVHIHGSAGIDVMDATPDQLDAIAHFLASQGVTGWVPTFVPAADEVYASAVAAIAEAARSSTGARVLGVHYEGPFVNSLQCGALHTEYFKSYSRPADLDFLITPDNGARMITLAPEIDGGIDLIRELKSRGWVISIGHTRASLDVLDRALEAGAHHMTHFMNAMSPLHHRAPGPIAWGLAHDDVTCDVIADGIHLDPFMLQLLMKVKGERGISLISDAIAAAGKGDGDYQIWGETISVRDGRTSNAAGSIAGSVITMLDAVRLMRSVGVPEVQLAQIASLNLTRLLGIDRECGSIEVGKRADLVALDEGGNVKLTLVDGRIAFRA
ncbi:MAG TPA: N-acetylglucosamine-6-phosphate deacetylase [Pyrinomonadaceae bacterium]|nr:N-acetylglucosamine-6-phosphate deacetylase [Pyrinomonadaceae bacterium]